MLRSLCAAALTLVILVPPAGAQEDIRTSVVKIFTTSRTPNPGQPWTKNPPAESTGTGVVIEGRRILTNAHVARYASQVFVQPYQSSEKLSADVEFIAPGIDLAILRLEDETFFDGRPVARLSDDIPRTKSKVVAYGYPLGGSDLSITEGIISRIEFAPYYYGTLGLRVQVDAALNPGNSGGPVLGPDGDVIGLVFSGIPEAENIGYLIPTEEIRTFLTDIDDGSYDGKVRLIASLQTVENPALRQRLALPRDVSGLMITRELESETTPELNQWDVIAGIGSYDIDSIGMIRIRDDLRLHFTYAVNKLCADGTVPLTVWRDGAEVSLEAHVSSNPPRLLEILGDAYPSYFIFGPLVFTPVYAEHVEWLTQGTNAFVSRGNPIATRRHEAPAFEGEELVTISSPMFPHRIAKGYDIPRFSVLDKLNGESVRSLRHLAEMLRDSEDEYLIFEWIDQSAEMLVFEREALMRSTEEVLEDNGIRSQYSSDLDDVWK